MQKSVTLYKLNQSHVEQFAVGVFSTHCSTVGTIICVPLDKFIDVVLVLCNQMMNRCFNEQCISWRCGRYLLMFIMQVNGQCIAWRWSQ